MSQTQIPDKQWTNPFPEGNPLHTLYRRRVKNEADLVIILDDYHARRGTGKTVASLQLAEGMDQNDGITFENVTLEPEEIRNAYFEQPQRSGLVLDEGEVEASNRQAMTKTNQALREIMSMGRVEEKYVVINSPSVGFIDKDIRMLADLWITMVTKGIGLVHALKRQPYAKGGSGGLLTEKSTMIEFKDIQRGTPLRDVYNRITKVKRERIRGDEGDNYIPEKEVAERVKKAQDKAVRENRNTLIRELYETADVSQKAIADAVGVSQAHVSDIVRGEA